MTLWILSARVSVKNPSRLILWAGEDVRLGIILFDHLCQNFPFKGDDGDFKQETPDGTKILFHNFDAYIGLEEITANAPDRVHEQVERYSHWKDIS